VRHATAVAVRQHLAGAVAASHPDTLGENLLQFRRRAARYQRPYQRQRVVVEVRLHTSCALRAIQIAHLLTSFSLFRLNFEVPLPNFGHKAFGSGNLDYKKGDTYSVLHTDCSGGEFLSLPKSNIRDWGLWVQ